MTTNAKLNTLADHIEKMERARGHFSIVEKGVHKFNMVTFMTVAGVKDFPENLKDLESCGTVCCIAGEALRIFNPGALLVGIGEISKNAAAELGLTRDDADYLFLGGFSESVNLSTITPLEAAAAIREVAKKYPVDNKVEAE